MTLARQHLDRARESRKRFDQETPLRRRQSLQRLLTEAAAAEQRGDLLTPPGDSAYDKLRAAQAIAPADRQCAPPPHGCCRRPSVASNASSAATGSRAPANAWTRAARWRAAAVRCARRPRAWPSAGSASAANAWARANCTPRAALQAARSLDGNAPGLAELAARVQAAGAASN
ncbi:hypothetical protein FE772_19505 [Lysobacter enzymogenes]|nr:hypothetical protein [Lysobacter enzymogenes]QCW27498.1 hypothetical protein FE772_19505 [Lysobacter enzymogenes]